MYVCMSCDCRSEYVRFNYWKLTFLSFFYKHEYILITGQKCNEKRNKKKEMLQAG